MCGRTQTGPVAEGLVINVGMVALVSDIIVCDVVNGSVHDTFMEATLVNYQSQKVNPREIFQQAARAKVATT